MAFFTMECSHGGKKGTKASAGFQQHHTHRQFHPEVPGSCLQPVGVEHKVVSPQAGHRHSIPEGPAGQHRARARPHVQGHVAGACGDRDVSPRESTGTCFPQNSMPSLNYYSCLPKHDGSVLCLNFFQDWDK